MKLHRFFSAPVEGQYDPAHVYNGLVFKEYVSVIRNADQSVLSKYHLVAPESWSLNAIDIMASKYCRKAGVPDLLTKVWEENIPEPLLRSVPKTDAVFGGEHDARQVIDRVVGCWAYHGWKMGYFDSPDEALIFFDELRWLIVRQYLAPASPQWFNAGLHWAYGIEGSKSGLWSITNDGAVVECENSYENPLLHACFIQGVNDDLIGPGGIMDLVTREARVFKFGGGSGTNFSSLRGKKEPLSGGGQSSGIMSFIKINDRAAGAIKSGGTTRRAARMVVVDVDHPEIEEFINWKVVEEDKVAALVAGSKLLKKFAHRIQEAYTNSLADLTEVNKIVKEGVRAGVPKRYLDRLVGLLKQGHSVNVHELTTDYEGEAYQTVSGQNANNTIRVTNEFMNNALNHQTYRLRYRTNLEYGPTVNAAEIFDKMNLATWISADPGIHFADTINGWNTCLNDGEIVASNPCSEYFWLNNTGCNLASLKLTAFVVGSGFHCEAFINAASLITIALDITVSIAGYPSKEIAQGSYMYRTLGLGYCDLGALLMRFGLPYDSDDARTFAGCLTAMMHFSSMRTSALLADELALSPFPRYADNKEHVLRVMRNHVRACIGDDNFQGLAIHPKMLPLTRDLNGFLRHYKEKADEIALEALNLVERYGLRNAQLTLLAPTGTIGLLLDCDTTGVEPDYALVKFKKLAGGGVMKIVNQSVAPALAKLGYASQEIENIKNYVLGVGNKCPEQFLRLLQQHQEINGVIDFNQVFDLRHVLPSTFPNIEHWNAVICGTGTLEGAPHLKPEHLPIFDCANRCGRTGTRYIGMTGHILMMAYVQPFLSGAISKTINLDEKATVETIREGNILSWQSSLKANAMYRDGSKLSQPLMAVDDDFADTTEEPVKAIDGLHKIVEAIEQRGIRRKLANKRRGYTRKLVAGGHKFYLRTGEYGDGTIGEIFLDSHKEGTSYRGIMNSFAMAVSLGLQYGVPLEEFVEAFSFQRYEPSGIVTGHDRLKVCTSILDLVFRDLAIEYLGRDDLAHTPPEGTLEEIVATDVKKEYASRATVLTDAKALGFEGSACSVCKSMTLVRRGKCLSCQTCGNSTGCD